MFLNVDFIFILNLFDIFMPSLFFSKQPIGIYEIETGKYIQKRCDMYNRNIAATNEMRIVRKLSLNEIINIISKDTNLCEDQICRLKLVLRGEL